MADRTSEHEKMPDRMHIANVAAKTVENNSDCIHHSSNKQQGDPARTDRRSQAFIGYDHQPPHEQVDNSGSFLKFVNIDGIENDP